MHSFDRSTPRSNCFHRLRASSSFIPCRFKLAFKHPMDNVLIGCRFRRSRSTVEGFIVRFGSSTACRRCPFFFFLGDEGSIARGGGGAEVSPGGRVFVGNTLGCAFVMKLGQVTQMSGRRLSWSHGRGEMGKYWNESEGERGKTVRMER